jgi:hypothetical protein
VVSKVVYDDSFDMRTEVLNDAVQQIVSHWSRRLNAFQPAVNGKYLDYTYYYREASLAIPFLEDYYLLVGRLVYDDFRKFNFDIHSSSFSR